MGSSRFDGVADPSIKSANTWTDRRKKNGQTVSNAENNTPHHLHLSRYVYLFLDHFTMMFCMIYK